MISLFMAFVSVPCRSLWPWSSATKQVSEMYDGKQSLACSQELAERPEADKAPNYSVGTLWILRQANNRLLDPSEP